MLEGANDLTFLLERPLLETEPGLLGMRVHLVAVASE
jgi:hypothetical protein